MGSGRPPIRSPGAALMVLLAACAWPSPGCHQDAVLGHDDGGRQMVGSGHRASQERPVAAFSALRSEGSVEVHYVAGAMAPLRVSGDDNLLDLVTTEVTRGLLVVATRPGTGFSTDLGLVVECSSPSLEALSIAGSAALSASGLQARELRAEITGSGALRLEGTCQTADLRITGSGSIHAFPLRCATARAAISGSGCLEVQSDGPWDARISGSGSIRYRGTAPSPSQVTGSGSITKAP